MNNAINIMDLDLCYQSLAAAVVERAAKDYKRDPSGVRKFFCDDNSLFNVYMPKADGKAVFERIVYNYKTYNRYAPPTTNKEDEEEIEDDCDEDFEEENESEYVDEWKQFLDVHYRDRKGA